MPYIRSFFSVAIGMCVGLLCLVVTPHITLANGDYVCQILEADVSTTGGINCNCTWGPWQPSGKRYCTGTRDPSVVIAEQTVRWGNTRIGCPTGATTFRYHDGFHYGDITTSSTTTGPSLSCQLEEIDGAPPFLEQGMVSASDGILNPNENAVFDIKLDDLESGVKNGSLKIRDPQNTIVFSQAAIQYTSPVDTGLISSRSSSVNWQPANIGTYTMEWSATDYGGNSSNGTFQFYVQSGAGPSCTSTGWSPSPATICSGTEFVQQDGCGISRSAVGTSTSSSCKTTVACTDTSWSPSPATICNGTSFVQQKCDQTRNAVGTSNDPSCTPGIGVSICGNAIVENGEQCDDGNTLNADQCSSSCQTIQMCSWITTGTGNPSNHCSGEIFHQMNTCGGYREAIGSGSGDCAAPSTVSDPTGDPNWQGGSVRLHCIDAGTAGCKATYYTTDGSYPTSASLEYKSPFNVPPDTIIRFFSEDKAGNVENVQTQVFGAGSNIHVYGPISATQAVSQFSQADSVGDLSLAEARTLMAKTLAPLKLMTGCSGVQTIPGAASGNDAAWPTSLTSCAKQDGNVLLFDGAEVHLNAAHEVVTLPTGKRSILIRGGNLHIKSNVMYPNNAASLGIIVLKDASGNGGNVYIYPNVTNMVGALYAEGTIQSVLYDTAAPGDTGADPRGFIEGTKEERAIFLTNQLLWQGSVISNNTIGGGESRTPYCPTGFTTCSAELAHQYDLASLRYLNRTSGKIAGRVVNGVDLPDPPGGQNKDYSIVIQYDSRISSSPPPLFSSGASTSSTEATY